MFLDMVTKAKPGLSDKPRITAATMHDLDFP